jgi:UDP-N-acetylmuramoylalanine--D-glutamate ligase
LDYCCCIGFDRFINIKAALMKDNFLSSQKIHIVGLGKSGLSAARYLSANNAFVTVWDDKESLRDEATKEGFTVLDLLTTPKTDFNFFIWSPGIAHHYPAPHPLAAFARAHTIPLICDVDVLAQIQNNADFIGITGTNGKSTTTALMAHVLGEFRTCAMGGNIGTPALNLPPLEQHETYVLELSSYQLELTPHVNLDAAILLNITPDHLPRHGNMEGYIAAKELIFAKNKDGISIIGVDTPPCAAMYERLKNAGKKPIPISTSKKLEDGVFVIHNILHDALDGTARIVGDMTQIPSLAGQHSHENAAAVYATLRALYDYERHAIFAAMTRFGGLPHRQFRVRNINHVTYINDSKATNADATSKALATFDNIFWIVGGQMKDGGLSGLESYLPKIRNAYTIGEAEDVFTTWLEEHGAHVTRCGVLEEAIAQAHTDAQKFQHDCVVLLSPACASWDQFKSFEDRGDQFVTQVEAL